MQIVELEMVPLSLRPVLQRLYDMKTTQSALREGVLFSTKRNNYYYDTCTGKVIVLDDDTSYIFRVLFDPTLSAETFLISLTKVDPNAVKNLLQTIDAERLFQRPPLLSMGKEIAAGVTDTEQKVEQIFLEVTEQCNASTQRISQGTVILGIGGCRQKLPLRQLIGRWKTAALNWQLLSTAASRCSTLS